MSTFKDRLKELRTSQQLTQFELAKKLNISRSIISMYELGERTPPLDGLEAISDFFNVDIAYLLGKSDVKSRYKDEFESIVYQSENKHYSETDDLISTLSFNQGAIMILDYLGIDSTKKDYENMIEVLSNIIKNTCRSRSQVLYRKKNIQGGK